MSSSKNDRVFTTTKYPNNSAVCAYDDASKVVEVRSNIECSLKCLQQGANCTHFNIKTTNTNIVCELFLFTPHVHGVTHNCALYKVSL